MRHIRCMKFLGYGRHNIDDNDISAVVEVLRGDYLTQGPAIRLFEERLASYVGARFAVAVSNGTTALHLACLAANLGSGDIGVTQAITFVASANCMAYCGARPDLIDIDPDTLNMSIDSLKDYLKKTPECKLLIPVAMGGLSYDGNEIRSVAGNRIIIEDACHAFGAISGNGKKVGGGGYADMTVFSFHPVKPITTGEGGAIVTDREDFYKRLLALRNHGIVREAEALFESDKASDPWYYEQQVLGFNYRISDIQAALGISQLDKIDRFIKRRHEIASYYDHYLSDFYGVRLVQSDSDCRFRSGHHLYIIRIDFDSIGKTRKQVMDMLAQRGIGTQVHYIPIHYHPYYRNKFGKQLVSLIQAESYYKECLTLPCHPGLSNSDLFRIVSSLKEVLDS